MKADIWTPARALTALAAKGALPLDGVRLGRVGAYEWQERGLTMRLSLRRVPPVVHASGLERQLVVIAPGVFGASEIDGGLNAVVAIIPKADTGEGADVLETLTAFVLEARGFVTGVEDLCWLLCQRADVQRGRLVTWLYQAYPARLVQALAIARHFGLHELERDVLGVLESGLQVSVSPLETEDVATVARRRVREYEKTCGVSLDF